MSEVRFALPGLLRATPSKAFVGRDAELDRLRAAWGATREGRRIALVAGEPGAGKSRLVRELALAVAGDGGLVLHGGCDPTAGVSYQPVTELLEQLFRHLDPDALAADLGLHGGDLLRIVPDLPRLVGHLFPPDPAPPETERHRLHLAVTELLGNASRRWPLLLVLDDLHWADRSTSLLLRHLFRTVTGGRLMLVGTYRDGEADVDAVLSELLADVARLDGVTRLRLVGLDRDAVAVFVGGGMGPQDHDTAAVVDALLELTDGNAFLLGEVWDHLTGIGSVEPVAGGWRAVRPLHATHSPDRVQEVVVERLARLAPATRTMLETAAVAGAEVGLALLRAASPTDEVALLTALEEALRSGVLVQDPGPRPRYRFSHELIRRAIVDRLNPLARARLHLTIAEALERLPEAGRRHLGDLATHFVAAAPLAGPDRGVAASLRAADAAARELAFDRAARFLTAALELGVPAADELTVRLRLGDVLRAGGAWRDAVEAYTFAARHARRDGDDARFAEAALGLEETCWRPGIVKAETTALLDEAIERLGSDNDRLTVRLLAASARAHGYRGAGAEAADARRAAVALARGLDDPAALAQALAQSYWGRGADPPAQVVANMDEALELAQRIGDDELVLSVRCWRGPALAEAGLFDELRRDGAEFRIGAERLGQHVFRHQIEQSDAALALSDGRLALAEELAVRALELSRLGGHDAGGAHGIQMFGIRREQARLGELVPLLRLVGDRDAAPLLWRPGLAALYAELEMVDEARAQIARLCADGFAEVGRDPLRLAALCYLADACVAVEDTAHAELIYEELEPLQGGIAIVAGLVACHGAIDRFLGALATTMGAFDRAERHLRAALVLNEGLGAATWCAHTRYHLARTLRLRARPGDVAEAALVLEEARRAARRHGLVALTARIDDLDAAHTPEAPNGLTAREVEVLRLVARGASNREIGEELFITQNTAANHVRSILMKTGCSNRTEAAAFAHRHHLVGTDAGRAT